ncbi:MAG: polysaccharide biosynthesis tyrosine autokinase [Symploca sp. SIO2E9]|nr:polysaccharide biosynthesis tyrosine autokinase [Symploca sp. SIO2E9]
MNLAQSSQPLPLPNSAQFNEEDEGGLDLGQVLGAINRSKFLIAGITTVIACAALIKAHTETPVYQASFEILTEPVTVETEVISSVPETLSNRQEATGTVDETKIKVLQSPRVLEPIAEKLKSKYPDISYGQINSGLSIKTNEPNILAISYSDPNPELIQDVLDLVSEAFLKYSLDERQADVRRGIKFVDEQLPTLRKRVDSLQEDLQKIRQKNNLVNPETKGQKLSEQISIFEQELINNQLQLDEARALYTQLQRELRQQSAESAVASTLSENSRYQNILAQLQEIDTQIAQQSVLFLENSLEMRVLEEQRQRLLPLLRREGERVSREAAVHIRELEVRNQALSQSLERLNQEVKQLSAVIRDYTDIQRELQIATDNLNQFLTTREALRIDAAQKQTPWELLVPISEPKASVTSLKNNLVLGTILGLLLGVGAALVVDQLRNVIHTPKQVKEITRLPLLGVIPFEKELGEFSPAEASIVIVQLTSDNSELRNGHQSPQYNTIPFFESFRSLNTNIRLLGIDNPIRSLVISSAMPKEGKSTVAVHLAQAAATMGQRVLIVDTDLRNPSLHQRTAVMNMYGLAEVISTDSGLENAIQQSPVEENLFVLTTGQTPLDSIRLLASQKMQDLMEKLQAAFDLVIYDAPTLLGFADASLLAAHANGILLVAGLGKLKRSLLEQALDEIKVSGTPVLGVVANGTGTRRFFGNSEKLLPTSQYKMPNSLNLYQREKENHPVTPES